MKQRSCKWMAASVMAWRYSHYNHGGTTKWQNEWTSNS